MERKPITVAELIAELQKLPGDTSVEMYGYACGQHFYEPLESRSLTYNKGRAALVILADWN